MSTEQLKLAKLRTDLDSLRQSLHNLRVKPVDGRIVASDETLRLWSTYHKIRARLLELDSELFSELREHATPKTHKSLDYETRPEIRRQDIVPFANDIQKAHDYLTLLENQQSAKTSTITPVNKLDIIAKRFHQAVRQLRTRHAGRATLDVNDEYDVQDLLSVFLSLWFDDIRPEEWTPSYAGKSARMDFLLKSEQIVIETKKSRKGLTAKKVGDELIVDIARYKSHPDCKTLFCFVYDPEGRIANPKGLEVDLSRNSDGIDVIVCIEPK